MVCLTSLEPLVLKNAPQQRCTRTAEKERNRNYTPQKTQQCDVNTITQCHRFSPSSSQSLVTQELECISKMQIHGIIKILIHAIIFIHFRPRFWKVTFVFLLTLKDLRFSFSRWTFWAVSCKAISGEELWGCQLFPSVNNNSRSLCTAPGWGETHQKWSITEQTEKHRNLIPVFSALSCLHTPGQTQAFPLEVYTPTSHYKQVPTIALQFGSH